MKTIFTGLVLSVSIVLSCYAQAGGTVASPTTSSNPRAVRNPTEPNQPLTPQSPVNGQNQIAMPIINVKYIPVKSFNNANLIVLTNIQDFSMLITDHNIVHVFYNDSTFFIQSSTLTVPVSIASNGYKSIADYQKGNQTGYTNGASYYYAVEHDLHSQDEVNYFKQEKFFSSNDYRQAQTEGFVKSGSNNRITRITGIIKKSDLEKNIYFANAIIYLMFYQQTDLVKSFLENKDAVALTLPFAGMSNRNYYMTNNSNIIVEFKTGYYYINLDISSLGVNKDAVFYYACKFAQYVNYTDYLSKYVINNQFTIKNSDSLARNDLKYVTYQDCLHDINALLGRSR
ncbi:MAG: hypothetical protein LBG90_08890 [Spirochaetaceae bacterium]|jgi:hypothetical protein|nr:hypothetical protein [Spirochaetaceae bacterium]